MRIIRRILMWGALGLILALLVLSVVGAFLGAETAGRWFNSVPMAVYWIVMLAFLVAGAASFPVMFRRPGLALMHLGCVAVLAGGLWGSKKAHEIRGGGKVHKGLMVVNQGTSDNHILGPDGKPIGELDFKVKLKKFWIEYYQPSPAHWPLTFVRLDSDAAGQQTQREHSIDWQVGREVALPGTDIHLTVLDYDPRSRFQPRPLVRAIRAGGKSLDVPAAPGATAVLDDLKIRLAVGHMVAVDAPPGHPPIPAVEVDVTLADGRTRKRLAFADERLAAAHARDELALVYVPASFNPGDVMPAMRVRLRRGRTVCRRVLTATDEAIRVHGHSRLALEFLFAKEHLWRWAGRPTLFLSKPPRRVKDYKSRLVITEHGRELPGTEKVIEVNDPLHYGGYHFYQNAWDKGSWRFTVLGVTSDSGLYVAYAGFVLLFAGTVVRFWAAPVLRAVRRGTWR